MIQRAKCLSVILITFLLSIIFVLITPLSGSASGLNASEQELMAKAKGTFEWNGKEYRAKQTYIDQLTAYLCRDDVDLNADTCTAAAAEMYGNVERGVAEGYLYEVGGSGETASEAAGEGTAQGYTGAPVMKEGQAEGENAADAIETIESETGSQEEKGSEQEGMSGDDEQYDEQFEERPGNKLDKKFKKCAPVIIRLPGCWWFGGYRVSGEKAGAGSDEQAENVPPSYPEKRSWLHLLNPTLYCLIMVCEAVCSVILITALAKTAGNRRLRCRSKARKALQTIVICMTVGACFLSGLLLSLRIGAFSEQAVLNQIEKTSWYQTVYDDMKREAFRTLSLVQAPEYDYGDTVKYSNVVLTARQQVKAELEGESLHPDLSGAMEPLRSFVSAGYRRAYPNSEVAATGVEYLMDGLEARCENLVHWAGMEWWRQKTRDFVRWMPVLLGGAVLVFSLGTAELICLSRSGYRAVKRFGTSLFVGFSGLAVCGLMFWRFGGAGTVWTKPVYMNEFARYLSVSAGYSAFSLGAMGCCLSAMAFYISKCMKYER